METTSLVNERSLFGLGPAVTTTRKIVKEVTEWHWLLSIDYELSVYRGSNPFDKVCVRLDYESRD